MNLLSQVESDLMPLGSELMSAWHALETRAKQIGAMVWGDVKFVGGAVEATVVADLKAKLPVLATQLQGYALTIVQDLEQGAWGVFSGQTKFGVATDQLIQAVAGGAFGPAVRLGVATAQTLIQDAYATFSSTVKQVTPATIAAPVPPKA